ncbi:MAG TPA: CaiB/BaiF CoA-transferase family protein [Burkholderiales bacterium]|nr:CaiB/BaiF CoA-transferase family protein [Burkholderiales bacterium]
MPSADALSHLRVIDLTRVRAGPTCVKQFADWGADVIKVEMPASDGEDGFGPRHGSDFQNLHRNKRSLTLNLKEARGVEVLKRLVKTADVVVENYRPDVKHRLGIDYESLARENPRLVYASISGFGQDGPYRDRAGFDQIAQGMGGLMWVTGLPGQGPVRAGIPVADLTAGLFAALGILIALEERNRSGKGQWVQSSLLSAMVTMMDFQAARWLVEGHVAGQAGNDHPTSIPTGVYPTSDGYVNIAAAGKVIWTRLCEALGAPGLATQAEYATGELRSKNRAALAKVLAELTRRHSSEGLIALLNDAGVPCGPIYKMDQVFADPQVAHLQMAVPVPAPEGGELKLVGPAMKLSRTPARMKRAIGAAGEHNAEILGELGYGATEIDALRAAKVI